MHSPLFTTILKALPLAAALFTIAADGEGCLLISNTNNGETPSNGGCPDLDDGCPRLECESGNVVNDDGCEICECVDSLVCDIENQPVPECANPGFDEDSCSWFCESRDECFSDTDCGFDSVCVFSCHGVDETSADCDFVFGQCVPVVSGCFSDDECSDGFRCDLSGNGSANDRDEASSPRPEGGVCVPVDQSCFSAEEDCGPGRHCEFFDNAGGLVVAAGTCVDDVAVSECSSNEECGANQVCNVQCGFDPGCPECDACFPVGYCVDVAVPCTSDADCAFDEVSRWIALSLARTPMATANATPTSLLILLLLLPACASPSTSTTPAAATSIAASASSATTWVPTPASAQTSASTTVPAAASPVSARAAESAPPAAANASTTSIVGPLRFASCKPAAATNPASLTPPATPNAFLATPCSREPA